MGKDSSKAQKKPKKIKIEISAGGVVYREEGRKTYILLIKDLYRRWALPKGKIEKDEKAEETAVREIEEETGISKLEKIENLGTIRYFFTFSGQPIFKIVHNFLFKTDQKNLSPSFEIKDAKWIELNQVLKKISYKNTSQILEKAIKKLEKE